MRYKLIKEYLGSNVIGTISESKQFPNLYSFNPEFWQEVVEKDYEILTLQATFSTKPIITFDCESYLENGLWNIHSVKRISDGGIFTIGDKIRHNNNVTYPEGIITKLDIISNSIFVETNNRNKGFHTNISLVHKIIKKPLFTTEDGVDIYEGDTYYLVNKEKLYLLKSTPDSFFKRHKNEKIFKYFKDIEEAEGYILMNKPCLSISDILKLQNRWSGKTIDKLKELVKNK